MTDQEELLFLLEQDQRERTYNKLAYMYPEEGPLRRELYAKQMAMFEAGAWARERGFMGGNGTGKTWGVGAYEMTLHLTGRYPKWWKGRRFDHPTDCWAVGKTWDTTRDIVQAKLLGHVAKLGEEALGTGMIPRDCIGKPKYRGATRAIDFVPIKHVSGGHSVLGFKSYGQDSDGFEGTEKHVVWPDEECPRDCYTEMLMRGRAVGGLMLTTFTPLKGRTKLVDEFLSASELRPKGRSIEVVVCDMDDVPHLTESEKRELLAGVPPWQIKSRKSGYPTVEAGLIYPVDEEQIIIPPFRIPPHFRRVYGFDGGWTNTAIVWIAYDADTDTAFIYKDYKRGEAPIPVHAAAIKDQGVWIPGIGDVYATDQSDGSKVRDLYREQGVRIRPADKAVDAGLQSVLTRMETNKLKVFSTCTKWIDEFRQYRRELKETDTGERSVIVKKNDHLMDATRYALYAGLKYATHQRPEAPLPTGEIRFGT